MKVNTCPVVTGPSAATITPHVIRAPPLTLARRPQKVRLIIAGTPLTLAGEPREAPLSWRGCTELRDVVGSGEDS